MQRDGSYKPTETTTFSARLWRHLNPGADFPRYFITADKLKVHEHIAIQEACQNWIDASISKTINLPKDYTYEEFVAVYDMAYEAGLKGCTTYRPSDIRGSILQASGTGSASEGEQTASGKATARINSRPAFISGITAKVKWPGLNSAAYVTLNRLVDGTPFEIFLHSKDQRNNEWMTVSTLLMSWLMRMGVELSTLCDELEQVHSLEGYFADGKYRPSLVSLIGAKLREMDALYIPSKSPESALLPPLAAAPAVTQLGERCPQCRSTRLLREQGCVKCLDCDYNKCG